MIQTENELIEVLKEYSEQYEIPKICIVGSQQNDLEKIGKLLFGKAEIEGIVDISIVYQNHRNITIETGEEQFFIYCLRPGIKGKLNKQFEQIRNISENAPVSVVLYSGLRCSKRSIKRCYMEALKAEIYPFRIDPLERKTSRDQTVEIYKMASSLFHIPHNDSEPYHFPGDSDLEEKRKQIMRKILPMYAAGAIAIGSIPIPFSDAFLLIPEQTAMAVHILSLFGAEDVRQVISPLISSTVLSVVGRSLTGSLIKCIPGVGSVSGALISGSIAGIFTFGLGMALCEIGYRYSCALKMGQNVDIKSYIQADELKKLTLKFMEKIKDKKNPLSLSMNENPTN